MGDFEVFNLQYLLTFLRAQINKAGILWLLGYRGSPKTPLSNLPRPPWRGFFMAAGIPEGFGRLFKLESVAMGRPDRANARVQECPLWVISGPFSTAVRMSAFGGKADSLPDPSACPLIAEGVEELRR